ncbi:MAG: phospholipase D family protein [Granulosicoccus sp.]|nr:phospholipase D family protein [Granulosicoccus sp.]
MIILWLLLAVFLLLLALRLWGNYKFPSPENGTSTETRSPFVESTFQTLGSPRQALAERIGIICNATRCIDLQYYAHADDRSGRLILAHLLQAAGRGVRVRILLDDIDLGTRSALFARLVLEYDKLEIRIFNPLALRRWQWCEFLARFPRANRRMHNKSLSVDRSISILGGRNIGDEYFSRGDEVWFLDHDVLVRGDIADQVAVQFDHFWKSALSVEIHRVDKPARQGTFARWHDSLWATLRDTEVDSPPADPAPALAPAQGRIIHDAPEKVVKPLFEFIDNGVATQLSTILEGARNDVLFTSPYLVPGEQGMHIIESLRKRGIQVTVLTNSFASNDVWLVNSGYRDYRERMLAIGVSIFELKPSSPSGELVPDQSHPISLHAKAFVIDHQQVFLGSLNFDSRSALHNTEMGVIFNDPDGGERVTTWIRDHARLAAYELSLGDDKTLRWREQRLRQPDIYHDIDPGVSRLSRMGSYVCSWLPLEWML